MKKLFIFILLTFNILAYSLNNRLSYSDEKIYFSIKLVSGDVVTLAGDGRYVVYRYGNDEMLKMEYPGAETDSKNAFTVNKLNTDGFEAYYVNFETESYNYRIFQEKIDNDLSIGIVVKSKLTNQTLEFLSSPETLIGNLKTIYDKNLVQREEM